MADYKICKELAELNESYDTSIKILDGLPFKQKDTIKMIEFYTNSKYLNGQHDELGREKPFYNIVNAMVDVEDAAKDLDTKDIVVNSDDGQHYVESFIMTKDIYEWMKDTGFSKTLNDIRTTHSRYGSVLVKKCVYDDEKTGEKQIKIEQPEWKNTKTDQVDILGGAIVETHYLLPSQMHKMSEWDEKGVREAIKLAVKDSNDEKNYNGRRVKVHEIRGEFPVSFIKEMEGETTHWRDDTKYSYQLWYLAGEIGGKLIPLYWEDDTERVYKYLARKERAGRAWGVGVVEEGEEAQVWTNDAILKQFRAFEYTSKTVLQTASKKLKGRNVLTEVDDGQILETEDQKPITNVQLTPTGGLGQFDVLINQWYAQFERTTSAYAAQRGENPASGTPFRLQAMVVQQSASVFVDLQEDLGIFITEIFEDWIMPFLAKKLNKAHILAHDFSIEELKEIDRNFATYNANQKIKEMILSGKTATMEDYEKMRDSAMDFISQTKNQRFLEIPKDYYKNFNAKISVHITDERRNKAAIMETLSNLLTVYARNPQAVQDPVLSQIFMKILEISGSGISPVSIMGAIQEQAKAMEAQQQTAQVAENAEDQALAPLSLDANPVKETTNVTA